MGEITGSGSSIQAPNRSGAPTSARGYLASASYMMAGAAHLSTAPSECAVACASLAAQALECALKSYLSHAGITERELRHLTLRHSLESLWTKAIEQGLGIPPVPDWCVRLDMGHNRPFFYRYALGYNGIIMPEPIQMIAELRIVLDVVRTIVAPGST